VPTEFAQLHVDDPDYGDLVLDAVIAGADDGEPVLLLHGWPETSHMWSRVIPALASSGLLVVAVDQRGFSPGARLRDTAAYTSDRLVRDVDGVINALGWPSAHLVGHDWGALVAWETAATLPAIVRSLTALSVPHPAAFIAALQSDPEQREKSGYVGFFRSDPVAAARVLMREGAKTFRTLYGDSVHARDIDSYVEHFEDDDALESTLRWYAAMDDSAMADVPPVAVPTTFVWGDEDVAVGAVAAHECGKWVSGDFDFRVLTGHGHWIVDEDPDAIVDAILARVG
jgi:pimeloyl-ACP methyl ester carboxylesterase